jgi:predicted TPR repeat methyltransferase
LSSGMLGGAEARNVYSDLHKAELVAFLDTHPGEFDVVISADTLCYFGQLHDAMRASAKALRPNGHVIFTVEALDDDSEPHRLLTSGRYSHSLPHVSVAATSSGLRVESIRRVKLRAEAGRPVIGWLVTLHRP